MASVTFHHVSKRTGSLNVLSNIHLEVADKEFLAIVGEGGSDLLKLVYGSDTVTSGEILIGDRIVNNVLSRDRDVTYTPGDADGTFGLKDGGALRRMTIYDNLSEELRERKTPKMIIDERVREASKALGIEYLLDRRITQLSRGQRQRAALVKAIVREPAMILLDDILSPLDPKLSVEAKAFLGRLHQRLQTTILMNCASLEEAMALGTRILILKNGEMQQIDSPYNIYVRPRNVTVFRANTQYYAPMLVPGRIATPQQGQIVIETAIGNIPVSKARMDALQPVVGKNVLFGVRPNDVFSASYIPPGISPFEFSATVEFTEFVNGVDYAHLIGNGFSGVAAIDPRANLQPGEHHNFVLNADNAALFDIQTETLLD